MHNTFSSLTSLHCGSLGSSTRDSSHTPTRASSFIPPDSVEGVVVATSRCCEIFPWIDLLYWYTEAPTPRNASNASVMIIFLWGIEVKALGVFYHAPIASGNKKHPPQKIPMGVSG